MKLSDYNTSGMYNQLIKTLHSITSRVVNTKTENIYKQILADSKHFKNLKDRKLTSSETVNNNL